MKKLKISKIMEILFLLIYTFIFLNSSIGTLWDHKISHEFPYGLMASDAFQHQTRIEGIKLNGNYRNEPFFVSAGFEDVVGYYPPLLYHLSILFSYASGLETYDTAYLLIFILAYVASLVMYLIIRNFNKQIAILSLPLSLLIFSRAPFTGFTWGHWPALLGNFFLVCIFYAVSKLESMKSPAIIIMIISGAILAHTSEAAFGIIFTVVFLFFAVVLKKKTHLIKNGIAAVIVPVIVTFYYGVIFKFAWASGSIFSYLVVPVWEGNLGFYMSHFGILLVFLIPGIIISIVSLLQKKIIVAILAPLFMLFVGYSNYFGFSIRAFQTRFFWPIYLSFFMGIALYNIIRLFAKKTMVISVAIAVILMILFNVNQGFAFLPKIEKISSQGLMNSYHWQTFEWIRENTDINSKVMFFYGDIYYQDAVLRNTQRRHFLVNRDDFIDKLQKGIISSTYKTKIPGDRSGGYLYRKSFFSFGFHYDEERSMLKTIERNVCDYDYYVFDKHSSTPALAQYNMLIRDTFLKVGLFQEVYNNELVSILRNNNPGDDCLAEQNIAEKESIVD